MRKLILFFSISFFVFSCGGAQDSVKSFEYDEKYVSDFETNTNFDISSLTFVEVDVIKSDFDKNGEQDIVRLYNCKGWENDPGDFRKVEIELNGSKIMEAINMGGWIRSPEAPYLLIDNSVPLLGFTGYQYASEPAYFTLITMNGGESKIVFNQKFELESMNNKPGSIELKGLYEDSSAMIEIKESSLKFID